MAPKPTSQTPPNRKLKAEQWGRAAEEEAARLYEAQGAEITGRRVRTPAGELDLIAEFPGLIIFIEVKARRTVEQALYALTPTQRARIAAAADSIAAERAPQTDFRIDLVALGADGRLTIVENALIDGFD
ncbi:MAG: YraN family protein [Rhodobacteraceae bacterium]|nr:YraN family protein [Paracoccaceae bacterium]